MINMRSQIFVMKKAVGEFNYDEVMARILSKNRWGNEGNLAKALGVSPNTWTAYKQGKTSFGLHDIAKICDVLGVTPQWLLMGDEGLRPISLLDRVRAIVFRAHEVSPIRLSKEALEQTSIDHFNALKSVIVDPNDDEEIELRLRLLGKQMQNEISVAIREPGTGKREAS